MREKSQEQKNANLQGFLSFTQSFSEEWRNKMFNHYKGLLGFHSPIYKILGIKTFRPEKKEHFCVEFAEASERKPINGNTAPVACSIYIFDVKLP